MVWYILVIVTSLNDQFLAVLCPILMYGGRRGASLTSSPSTERSKSNEAWKHYLLMLCRSSILVSSSRYVLGFIFDH